MRAPRTAARRGRIRRRPTLWLLLGQPALRPDASASWAGHTFDLTGATLDGGDLGLVDLSDPIALSYPPHVGPLPDEVSRWLRLPDPG